MTQLSPVIKCGPPRIQLSKSVVLEMPHCASLKHGFWNLSLYAVDHEGDDPDPSRPSWKRVVSLGQETINTPVFVQLDADRLFLVTDVLSTFVLVGESFNGKAVKALQLALYASVTCASGSSEHAVRVYVFEDTPCAPLYCQDQERRLGGVALDRPRTLLFRDGGADLCLSIDNVSPGWRPRASRLDVPFSRIWNSVHNASCFGFVLEKIGPIADGPPEFGVHACQRGDSRATTLRAEGGTRPQVTSNPLAGPEPAYRIPSRVRKALCALLDPPSARDWRSLAAALGVDRYPTWFATKPSPTDVLLELWEARHRERHALAELLDTLASLHRHDAADLLRPLVAEER